MIHVIGPPKIPQLNIPKEVVGGAWGSIAGSDSYLASNDASLFSSSLPVLPHEKRMLGFCLKVLCVSQVLFNFLSALT